MGIATCLWFNSEAEEAARFYVSVFKGSLGEITRYPKAAEKVSGKKAGSVLTVEFEVLGQKFVALNGGPIFQFNQSVSFMVPCKNQEEIDYYWSKLSAAPEDEQCGWCKDKFGVSWQVFPRNLNALIAKNPEKVTAAFLEMKKFDIKKLEGVVK